MFDRLPGSKENRNHQQTGHRGSKVTENEQQNRVTCFVHSRLNLPATNQVVASCANTHP